MVGRRQGLGSPAVPRSARCRGGLSCCRDSTAGQACPAHNDVEEGLRREKPLSFCHSRNGLAQGRTRVGIKQKIKEVGTKEFLQLLFFILLPFLL